MTFDCLLMAVSNSENSGLKFIYTTFSGRRT